MNESHRRVAATALLRLNKTVSTLERLLDLESVREPMFSATNSLTSAQRQQVAARIREIRAAIARLASASGLAPEDEDLFRSAWAELNAHWVSLEDSKSRALSHYGSMEAKEARTWDPTVDKLIALVNALTRELRS